MLRERWIDAAPPFEEAHFLNGFPQPDKRFHFAPDWAATGREPGLHAAPARPHGGDRCGHAGASVPAGHRAGAQLPQHQLHRDATSRRKREGRPTVLVHPDDAARLGIAEGARVRLGNARGEVVLHARLVEGLQPGVLVAESIWPSERFEGGIGINALTSDDPGPPIGGAVFHDTAVWLRAAAAEMPLAAE